MPFTLIHGLISYLGLRYFSKDKNVLRLAFLGGLAPDIDGYPLLLGDFDLYRKIHHEWLHPPIYGLLFGIFFSAIFWLYCKKKKIKFNYFAGVFVFFLGFLMHSLVDLITSDWAFNFIYPFGNLYLGDILSLKNYFLMNALDLLIVFLTLILLIYFYTKDKNVLFELFKS
ncbi:MAG: metal-dependent hydrolase [archaeon]